MKTTGDQQLVKRINRSVLLRLLRSQSGLSRAQLAVESGLTKSTVSLLVRELIDEGWLTETDATAAPGLGRPSTPLQIDGRSRGMVGVEVADEKHVCLANQPFQQRPGQSKSLIAGRAGDQIKSKGDARRADNPAVAVDLPDTGAVGEPCLFDVFDAAGGLFMEEALDDGLLRGGLDVQDIVQTYQSRAASGVFGDAGGESPKHVVGPCEGACNPFVRGIEKFGRRKSATRRREIALGGLGGERDQRKRDEREGQ